MDDREIIRLLQESPNDGIREAIIKYRGLAAAIIGRVISDKNDCEECVSDVFVSVWKNRENLDGNRSLKGYTAVAARNTAINYLKKAKARPIVPLDESVETDGGQDIEYAFGLREDLKALEKEVRALKGPHDVIFVRRHYLFESVKEIADSLHIDEKQVKNSLYYSKKKIKKSLMKGRSVYEKK